METAETFWVVLDDCGQVLVMASGRDAAEFAAEWGEQGAQVVEVRDGTLAA